VEFQQIKSGLIEAARFDEEAKAMEVKFKGGRTYRYTGPKVREHYDGLMGAESAGKYFGSHIRNCSDTQCEAMHQHE
jgi:hypothetical protein